MNNNVPVIINSYNRLEPLHKLILSLESRGFESIIILDNNSTYPPLLEYYKHTPHRVIRLKQNLGYLALWDSDVFNFFCESHYIYTDSDVVPIDACPDNICARLIQLLDSYPTLGKIGLGLAINDLPDHFGNKRDVIAHEKRHWKKKLERDVFIAPIDTTFALYRPGVYGGFWVSAARTGYPYVAQHLPWYADTENPSEEEEFYIKSISQKTHWSGT